MVKCGLSVTFGVFFLVWAELAAADSARNLPDPYPHNSSHEHTGPFQRRTPILTKRNGPLDLQDSAQLARSGSFPPSRRPGTAFHQAIRASPLATGPRNHGADATLPHQHDSQGTPPALASSSPRFMPEEVRWAIFRKCLILDILDEVWRAHYLQISDEMLVRHAARVVRLPPHLRTHADSERGWRALLAQTEATYRRRARHWIAQIDAAPTAVLSRRGPHGFLTIFSQRGDFPHWTASELAAVRAAETVAAAFFPRVCVREGFRPHGSRTTLMVPRRLQDRQP